MSHQRAAGYLGWNRISDGGGSRAMEGEWATRVLIHWTKRNGENCYFTNESEAGIGPRPTGRSAGTKDETGYLRKKSFYVYAGEDCGRYDTTSLVQSYRRRLPDKPRSFSLRAQVEHAHLVSRASRVTSTLGYRPLIACRQSTLINKT
ncbi:hypothetical protein EVAR_77627_1 [Eumeta japonica]|uniref:Uncharacterized protein n=1 Tax=Eumeta variegata TaxID=151549 RepID=A0A4C1T7R5_EUMVA|nr:hypothetical protein EVAR_77627_1 [Eumeta japonica]